MSESKRPMPYAAAYENTTAAPANTSLPGLAPPSPGTSNLLFVEKSRRKNACGVAHADSKPKGRAIGRNREARHGRKSATSRS